MTIDRLREAAKAQPFRPFTISLADGRRLTVPHPEFVWVPPNASRTFYVAGTGERESIVDLLLVTSIDFGNGKDVQRNRRGKNGKPRPGA
jgi:hypothetical protein